MKGVNLGSLGNIFFLILSDIVFLAWILMMLFFGSKMSHSAWAFSNYFFALLAVLNYFFSRFIWIHSNFARSSLNMLKFYVLLNCIFSIFLGLLHGPFLVKVAHVLHSFWFEKWGGAGVGFLISIFFIIRKYDLLSLKALGLFLVSAISSLIMGWVGQLVSMFVSLSIWGK